MSPAGWTIGLLSLTLGASAPPLRIYVARHGQTDWNRDRRLQGQADTQLDETGREQAQMLAERLRGIHLDKVYASTLSRSLETALAARGEAPLEAVAALREQSLGIFEDLCLDGSEPRREAEYRRRSASPRDRLDGGESEEEFAARVEGFAARLRAEHRPGETLLVVGHGGTNRLLLRRLAGLTAPQAEALRLGNDDVYLVELPADAAPRLWMLVALERLGSR